MLFSSESSPLQAWKGTTLSWTSAAVDGATASLDQSVRELPSLPVSRVPPLTTLAHITASNSGFVVKLDRNAHPWQFGAYSRRLTRARANTTLSQIQRSLWRHQFEDGTRLEHIAEQSSGEIPTTSSLCRAMEYTCGNVNES